MPETDTRKIAKSRIGKYGEGMTLKVDGAESRVLLASLSQAPVGFFYQRGSSRQHLTIESVPGVSLFNLSTGRQDFVFS